MILFCCSVLLCLVSRVDVSRVDSGKVPSKRSSAFFKSLSQAVLSFSSSPTLSSSLTSTSTFQREYLVTRPVQFFSNKNCLFFLLRDTLVPNSSTATYRERDACKRLCWRRKERRKLKEKELVPLKPSVTESVAERVTFSSIRCLSRQ